MAQISSMAQGIQTLSLNSNLSKTQKGPLFSNSLFFGSKKNSAKSLGVFKKDSVLREVKKSSFRISASVATAEKPHEIVLEPIKDISGTVKLPGSKSLSNRILLLAALSEVKLPTLVSPLSFRLGLIDGC